MNKTDLKKGGWKTREDMGKRICILLYPQKRVGKCTKLRKTTRIILRFRMIKRY